jgi:membrane protein required for colicin V production
MVIDAAFLLLMVFAVYKGFRKGLIIAVFSIIGFVVGLAAAMKLSAVVAGRLGDHISSSSRWLPLLSFIFIFLLVAILVNLGGRLLQKSFETAMLGWVNRLAGAILFILLYSFIFSIFLFYASQLHFIKPEMTGSSYFYPYIQPLGPKVIDSIGGIIPFFKDMFAELQNYFGGLSNKLKQ